MKISGTRPSKPKQPLPFSFILDYLYPLEPTIKPMFGCHALYVGKKVYFILRKRKAYPSINGIWIATTREHHQSLKKELPSMKSITVLGKAPTNWQIIPDRSKTFEEEVIRACELAKKGDIRIGKVPKKKKKH